MATAAGIDPKDDDLMREYCGQILGFEVQSRSLLTTEQLRKCADYLEDCGLPERLVSQGTRTAIDLFDGELLPQETEAPHAMRRGA